jgi:quercetin dioxygenase-like cupin family protein
MAIIHKLDAPVFSLPGLTVQALASPRRGALETSMWQIALSPGAPGVPHSVTREEIFVALSGKATVTLNGEELELSAGDALVVPANVQFSLANPTEQPFCAIVSLPVGGQAVTADGSFTPPWAE